MRHIDEQLEACGIDGDSDNVKQFLNRIFGARGREMRLNAVRRSCVFPRVVPARLLTVISAPSAPLLPPAALPLHLQTATFNWFKDQLDAAVREAKANGSYDRGLQARWAFCWVVAAAAAIGGSAA